MNDVQKIQFDRMRRTSFNDFDGAMVARELESISDRWKAVLFGRFANSTLIELRDLADGHINADTVMILAYVGEAGYIMEVAEEEWHADEVGCCWIVDGTLRCEGQSPFTDVQQLHRQYGATLNAGEALIRLWWD